MTYDSLSIGFDLMTMGLTAVYMAKLLVGDSGKLRRTLLLIGESSSSFRFLSHRTLSGRILSTQAIDANGQLLEGTGMLACETMMAKPSLARQLVTRKSY